MRTPEAQVLLADGTTVPLASLYSQGPIALVFLRHFGCIFCRRFVSKLKRATCLRIVLVGMADPAETQRFAATFGVKNTFICDPSRELYRQFGLERGRLSQVVGPKVWKSALGAARFGVGKVVGDPLQLSGAFVINTCGEIIWSKRAHAAGDDPTLPELCDALLSAEMCCGES
jgi:hypothetical protein